ncbi:MAG: FGGY family carbohydrate kinase [Sphaerochaetaceae bacterium]|nr:FGGY family carbohydrate kinase [Sphaerochaetaceae bacterium]
MSSFSIVIDQGTSGTKASVVSDKLELLCSNTQSIATKQFANGFVEQNPLEIVDSVYKSIENTIKEFLNLDHKITEIACCGISNQRESFLIWDQNGNPYSPVISWQCTRSSRICEELKSKKDLIKNITGLRLNTYFSGTKLLWLIKNDGTIKNLIENENAYFGTIDTWLIYNLTNKEKYLTDVTNASRTLLFDLKDKKWSKELCKLFQTSKMNLPEILPSDSNFGRTDFNGILPNKISITGVVGDSQAACIGEHLFEKGDLKVTMGTGSSVLLNTKEFVSSNNGMVSTICWNMEGETSYGLEGIITSCGSTLTWIKDQLHLVSSFKEIDQITEKTPSSFPVSFIPSLNGIGAPFWKMHASGSFLGLNFGVDKNKIIRAVAEAYPFMVNEVIHSLEKDSKIKISKIKADGGLTNSKVIMQIIADITNSEIQVSSQKEASTMGAAILSLIGSKIISKKDVFCGINSKNKIKYHPNENKLLLDSNLIWKSRIENVKEESFCYFPIKEEKK